MKRHFVSNKKATCKSFVKKLSGISVDFEVARWTTQDNSSKLSACYCELKIFFFYRTEKDLTRHIIRYTLWKLQCNFTHFILTSVSYHCACAFVSFSVFLWMVMGGTLCKCLIIAELAERSPLIIQNQAEKIWMYDRTTVQGATLNMRGQLYRGHANATALSSSPVVIVLGSESDDRGSSPGRGKALCPCGKKNASSAFRLG